MVEPNFPFQLPSPLPLAPCFCAPLSPYLKNRLPISYVTPGSSAGKESAHKAGDLGSVPGWGRSPGEGKGSPLQCSGLENPMDCTVHGVAVSGTRLRDFPFTSPRVPPSICMQGCSCVPSPPGWEGALRSLPLSGAH